eukprot:493394-Amorphochlora_amoeboformis.AAC.1
MITIRNQPDNAALVHCQSGRGRTFMTVAAYLVFSGKYETFSAALEALTGKDCPSATSLLVPSQHRYLDYFEAYLKHGLPEEAPRYQLTKIVCRGGTPRYAALADPNSCRPYIQLFSGGKLVFTSTGETDSGESK